MLQELLVWFREITFAKQIQGNVDLAGTVERILHHLVLVDACCMTETAAHHFVLPAFLANASAASGRAGVHTVSNRDSKLGAAFLATFYVVGVHSLCGSPIAFIIRDVEAQALAWNRRSLSSGLWIVCWQYLCCWHLRCRVLAECFRIRKLQGLQRLHWRVASAGDWSGLGKELL